MDGWIIKQAEEHFHNRKLYTTLAIYEAIKCDVTHGAQVDRGDFCRNQTVTGIYQIQIRKPKTYPPPNNKQTANKS